MNIISGRTSNKYIGVLITLLFCALLTSFTFQSLPAIAVYQAFVLYFIAVYRGLFSAIGRKDQLIISYGILILTASLPIGAIRDPAAIWHYLVEVAAIACAYIVTRDPAKYFKSSQIVLLLYQGAILIYLLAVGLEDFPLDNMIEDTSSNGVTSYIILLQVNYGLVKYLIYRRVSLGTSLVTVAICYVGYGRGSLVASISILLLNMIFVFFQGNIYKNKVSAFISIVAIFGIIGSITPIATYLEENTKIGIGLSDDHRELIIETYLDSLDGITFFAGAGYEGTVIGNSYYNNNPHNSYIRAHHIFGLPFLLFMLVMPLAILLAPAFAGNVNIGKATVAYGVIIYCVLLIRAFTETIIFPTVLDLFVFSMVFVSMRIGDFAASAQPAHTSSVAVKPATH